MNENVEVNAEAVANEVVKAKGTGKGLVIAAIVGAVVLAGGIVYKYIALPGIAKRKAKNEAEAANSEATTVEQTNG